MPFLVWWRRPGAQCRDSADSHQSRTLPVVCASLIAIILGFQKFDQNLGHLLQQGLEVRVSGETGVEEAGLSDLLGFIGQDRNAESGEQVIVLLAIWVEGHEWIETVDWWSWGLRNPVTQRF